MRHGVGRVMTLAKIMHELGCNTHMAQCVKDLIARNTFGWSEEVPDQEGWWWCLGPNRIVHVKRQRAFGDRLCAHMISEWVPVDEIKNVLWAGPIPPPRYPDPKCWVCGSDDPVPQVHYEVSCKSPGGEPCEPYQTLVHFGCVQDMDQ